MVKSLYGVQASATVGCVEPHVCCTHWTHVCETGVREAQDAPHVIGAGVLAASGRVVSTWGAGAPYLFSKCGCWLSHHVPVVVELVKASLIIITITLLVG